MNDQNCHCKDAYQDRLFSAAGHIRSPVMVARRHQIAWRSALARLATPQMVDDLLDDLDACKSAGIPHEDA
jgi:hypothetical protein